MVSRLREHAQRPRRKQFGELIRIAGESEEVVLLFNDVGLDLVFRAATADQLVGRLEALAADTVEAAVGSLVEVAGRDAGRPEALCPFAVTPVRGGPDEIIMADVKRLSQSPKDLRIPIDERPDRDPPVVLGQAARHVSAGGRIVAFSSSVAAKSFPTYGPYIASKAGVEGLVHVLTNELRGRISP
jgi:3-oxoacyl-[acyl-carrier protein] reductase